MLGKTPNSHWQYPDTISVPRDIGSSPDGYVVIKYWRVNDGMVLGGIVRR